MNERSHAVLKKSLAIAIQARDSFEFDRAVREATMAYNTSYHAAIRDCPYFRVFGRDPCLPGFQSYARAETEDTRTARLTRTLASLAEIDATLKDSSDEEEPPAFSVGDRIVFYRSGYERARDSTVTDPKLRAQAMEPKWSLPARVVRVGKGQLSCIEIGTSKPRDVPFVRARHLPTPEYPTLQKIYADQLDQALPRRPLPADLPWNVDSSLQDPQRDGPPQQLAPDPLGSSSIGSPLQKGLPGPP